MDQFRHVFHTDLFLSALTNINFQSKAVPRWTQRLPPAAASTRLSPPSGCPTPAGLSFTLGLKREGTKEMKRKRNVYLIGELCSGLAAFMKHPVGEEVETIG